MMGAVEALASDCMDLMDGLGVGLVRGGAAAAPGSDPAADAAELATKPRAEAKEAREAMERQLSASGRAGHGARWGSGRREGSTALGPTLGRMRGVSVSSTWSEGGLSSDDRPASPVMKAPGMLAGRLVLSGGALAEACAGVDLGWLTFSGWFSLGPAPGFSGPRSFAWAGSDSGATTEGAWDGAGVS